MHSPCIMFHPWQHNAQRLCTCILERLMNGNINISKWQVSQLVEMDKPFSPATVCFSVSGTQGRSRTSEKTCCLKCCCCCFFNVTFFFYHVVLFVFTRSQNGGGKYPRFPIAPLCFSKTTASKCTWESKQMFRSVVRLAKSYWCVKLQGERSIYFQSSTLEKCCN